MSQQNVQFDGTLSAGYTLGYNYNTATGRKFQMSSVTDVNYRVASATVSNSDRVNERHTYEYDKNVDVKATLSPGGVCSRILHWREM